MLRVWLGVRSSRLELIVQVVVTRHLRRLCVKCTRACSSNGGGGAAVRGWLEAWGHALGPAAATIRLLATIVPCASPTCCEHHMHKDDAPHCHIQALPT